jgi:phosphopantothenoylcysteine synthetase/decarboxylase
MPVAGQPVLYIVACGGRPAADLPAFVTQMHGDGWHVCVIATPSAVKFMDLQQLAALTGHTVRSDYKQPDQPDVLPPADAFVIAPATFNTINKLTQGISDTLALGLLNEAIGMPLPIVAVPTPNVALARHPAFRASVTTLRSWGVHLIFDPNIYPLPTPNMGPPAAALFPWPALAQAMREVHDTVTGGSASPAVAGPSA